MASIEGNDHTEKAELEELMSTEVTKSLIAEAESRNQISVIGQVLNNRRQPLRLLATTSWTGSFVMPPPNVGEPGIFIRFSHHASKGALIYSQAPGSSNAAVYLLAWSVERNLRNRKVYAKCGPISEVHYDGWERAALTSLDSSDFNSSDKHDGTSSSVVARIDNASGRFPLGAVLANFN
ncbi:hypothetical protein RND81_09G252600 [Saponaria officinalis]|uniref:Uncharacterized protein n=1 Tax=Saponaria officinalis TaxID=3572 RepID=A0AAW1IRH1_SAPOF